MHKNTFLTTPELKKKIFKDLILVARKCIKTRFYPTPEVKKIIYKGLDSGG